MGRHTAAEDAPVHPVVAASLARRAGELDGGPPAHGPDPEPSEGDLGWPAPPGRDGEDGGGLGWPGELPDETGLPDGAGPPDETVPGPPVDRAPARRRRGLRRLFGRAA